MCSLVAAEADPHYCDTYADLAFKLSAARPPGFAGATSSVDARARYTRLCIGRVRVPACKNGRWKPAQSEATQRKAT